jgi:hypothetical protein
MAKLILLFANDEGIVNCIFRTGNIIIINERKDELDNRDLFSDWVDLH